MQKAIFVKEKYVDGEKLIESFTTLTGLLKSEGLERLYFPVRNKFKNNHPFVFSNITISKVRLNHGINGKRIKSK